MRVLVDLPEGQLKDLARIGDAKKRSRAAVIREAVSEYIARNEPADAVRKAFGIWRDLEDDSVEYQRKLRDEW